MMSWNNTNQTNVPDYEKMLHAPTYTGWSETDEHQPQGRLTNQTTGSLHYPENTTHEPRIYQPAKYSLVKGSNSAYHEYEPPTREVNIQYLSSNDTYDKHGHKSDYGYQTMGSSYQTDIPRVPSSYNTGHSYRTLPLRGNHADLMYRTPSKTGTLPSSGTTYEHAPASLHPSGSLRHSTSAGDLRHWQQLHQEQLLHQHIETQALYDKPASASIDYLFKQLSMKEEDVIRWEPIRRAADSIIQEKNMIIEKLKTRILQLEEDCNVNENRLKHALITSHDDQGDSVQLKMKELQYKYSTLKTELLDTRSQKNMEIDELEVKLGAAEYELDQLKKSLKNKDSNSTDLQTQLEDKEREASEWQKKFTEMKDSSIELKRKLDSLEQYLGDLPTAEETAKTAQESERLKEEMTLKETKIQELERKLNHARKVLTHKEFQQRELLDNERHLKEKMKALSDENDKLKLDDTTAALFRAQEEIRDVREDKERLAIDLEKAKKLLEGTHRKLQQQEARHQTELRQLTEHVKQQEEAADLLRQEIETRDEQINKLQKSTKEISSQYQDILQGNKILKEQLQHYESKCTDSNLRQQRRFMHELGLCFNELQSLVQVCTQRAKGEDPNMSVLLGVRSDSFDDSSADMSSEVAGETIAQWTSKLKELRAELDRLRGFISNKYAEDMADNINCTTQ